MRVRAREAQGFTLVELLVALGAGMVVITAMLAILISSVKLSSNAQDRIESNQQGRLAMTRLVQALNSSCVAASTPPVLAGSTANEADFYSSLSDSANINPSEVKVAYTGTSGGALTMSTYPWSSGSTASSWTFSTTPTTYTLLSHMTAATIGGTSVPVFRYYGYTAGGSTISTTPYGVPLSSADAQTTAEVTISFEALPTDNWNATGRGATFTDSVVLRLTPASGAASASNTPCT